MGGWADLSDPDDRLMADLARVAADRDPVPPELVEMARESLTWRTVDADLAELIADSLDPQFAASVRAAATSVRLLTFAGRDGRLEVEVLIEGATRQLVGELLPAQPARLVVEHSGGALVEEVDEEGRFLVSGVPAGHVRLRCEREGKKPLVTAWVEV